MNTAVRRVGRAVLLALLTGTSAVLLATVLVPLALGWIPLTVLSGSMEPTLPVGSQVVVEPLDGPEDAERLSVGDVVTFMPRPDDATLVTHRIVGVASDGNGELSFTTQGDANDSPDGSETTHVQLRGLVRYHVPYAGYAATLLDAEQKRGGVMLAAAALVGYALWQVVGVGRDRRCGARTATAAETTTEAAPQSPVGARPEPATQQLPVVAGVTHHE